MTPSAVEEKPISYSLYHCASLQQDIWPLFVCDHQQESIQMLSCSLLTLPSKKTESAPNS